MVSSKRAVRTSRICETYGIAPSTLQYWVRIGLVEPSVVKGSGKRFERWWSPQDVVRVRAVKALRDGGCSLQKIRAAKRLLKRFGTDLAASYLVWDGNELFVRDSWGTVTSTFREPGQMAFHAVVIPIASWSGDVVDLAEVINVRAERKRRQQSRSRPTERLPLSS